jgi:hypothetical protein
MIRKNPAFDKGVSAFIAGEAQSDNPFGVFSSSYGEWSDGWLFAATAKDHDFEICFAGTAPEKPKPAAAPITEEPKS